MNQDYCVRQNIFFNLVLLHLTESPIDFNVAIDTSHVHVDFSECKTVLVGHTCVFTVEYRDSNNNNNKKEDLNKDVKAIITSKYFALRFISRKLRKI
jgi:hypothetical protein